MIGLFRKFLNTRAARLFFIVLIVPFVLYGVVNVAQNFGGSTWVAKIGDRTVEPQEFQEAFRAQLNQVTRQMGGKTEPTPAIRRAVAAQALDRLMVQAAIAGEVRSLGLAVPDAALRQTVFQMPAFLGASGTFERPRFEQVLRQNNLTEGRFLELMRTDLGQRELMDAVQVGSAAPDTLLRQVFEFQRETRVLDMVELPFAAVPEPAAPTEAELRAAYADDPGRYSAPAFRRVKAVVLSPETLARDIEVSDADAKAYYDAHPKEFGSPAKRSVQVLVAQDEAVAQRLAAQWAGGADWAAMQKAAADAGASAATIDDSTQSEIPGDVLAEAVFKAPVDTVTGPLKSEFGWPVLRVTKASNGDVQPLEAVLPQVKQKLARERAADGVYDRSTKLADVLAAGNTLDQIPADLGAMAISGMLDAKGDTQDGEPAPIPGTPALRQAFVATAYATPLNQPPTLVDGPDQSFYALVVEDETPPTVKPFEAVEDEVRANWLTDTRRRVQERVAAKLLGAVNAGSSLEDAATVADVHMERSPPMLRDAPTDGVPPELTAPAFGLGPKGATMIETATGFYVVQLDSVSAPPLSSDPVGATQMRAALNQMLSQDIEVTFALALRERAKPTVNRALFESLAQ